ncbi:histidine kinase [Stenotrophomonas panacihumi]|uniref:Sensory/regulatory protein RpfC n=1 Tax=Stenotrophomonas panacihumi TaxID=676599 RepID=A0A0R0AAY6_9GAMM|nr:ATP-binding protein [Stenotrophomonas panacihumi]KRG37763.1 histidine kinase [Stenotrophomonas panacihumi]PTN56287.1 hybrid sensor histidine kinase/response regulator [Stenotrophomonas panacihumi]
MPLASGQGAWLWLAVAAVALVAVVFALVRGKRLAEARHQQALLRDRLEGARREIDGLRQDLLRHDQLEQQLLQAKQAAEAAVLAKGEFLATMSHEIRTPLNGIIPMLDLVSRGALAADQREMLQTAMASSLQLLRIVDDILDYSKLEADKLELEITTFNLRELMDGVVQLMQRAAEDKHLRLDVAIDPAVRLSVRGDPVRLRQVLGNLIGNALKFTERGGIDVSVRRLGETKAQHLLRFQVRDSGIGIAPEQQARLFRAFTQADASTTRLYGGTGLGLVICKRIIDLMGGRIGVESAPGAGATFWFEIPLLKVIGDLQQGHALREAMRVLLVSSDDRLRQRMQMLMRNWGIGLHCVDSTQEALERMRASAGQRMGAAFDVVIADHEQLRYSARALHRGIARAPEHAGTRLIWLVGDEPLPDELDDHLDRLPRQASDAELRAALVPERRVPAETEDAGSAIPQLPPPSAATASDLQEPRILLVEDNPVNLIVAQKMLATLGYEAEVATHGEAALDSLRQHRHDLVFMDCQMPVLDGYEATRRWRALEAEAGAPRLPIVAMTANAMAGDRERCLEAGMDDYLPKPVSREQLESCLARWLPRRGLPLAAAHDAEPQAEIATPAMQSAALPILDTEVLDELHEVAGAETASIVQLFLEDAPRLIARLEAASGTRDNDELREASHTLKSSSANVGAIALANAARRIELAARAGPIERPAVMVALVIAEYARARLALTGQIARLQRPLAAGG